MIREAETLKVAMGETEVDCIWINEDGFCTGTHVGPFARPCQSFPVCCGFCRMGCPDPCKKGSTKYFPTSEGEAIEAKVV